MKSNQYIRSLAALLACAVIAACAGWEVSEISRLSAETATLHNTPQAAVTSTPAPTKEVKPIVDLPAEMDTGTRVIFWHPWSGETANLIAELSEEFNRENEWDIEVIAQAHGDERTLIQDFEEARENEEMPDVAALPVDYLMSLQQQGVPMWDLDVLVHSPQWGLPEERVASFFPLFWSAAALEGGRVGLPAYWSGYYLAYNQSWAGELGFAERPATVADFEAQACAAAQHNLYDGNPDTNGTGGYIFSLEGPAIFSWMRAFGGGEAAGESGERQLAQVGDVAAGEFLYDLYLKDCAWTGRQELPYQYFSNRLALFYSGRLEDILIQGHVNQINNSADQWTLIPYPPSTDKPVVFIEGSAYAIITADPQKALAAWEWIKWLLEPQQQARLVEVSASFPLSTEALDELEAFRLEHPLWSQALQYLAMAETVPLDAEWQMTKDVLADYAWQLIRFTTNRADIPQLLRNAEELVGE